MTKLRKFIKSELTGWKKWEILWMVVATAVILGLSIYWGENALGLIMALTGV